MAAGDLIYVSLKWQGLAYRHYGIDMGDGTAIHLASDSDSGAAQNSSHRRWDRMEVRRAPLKIFAGSPDQRVIVEPTTSALPIEKTLELAQQSLGQKGYHLSENNCEHFARYCKTGVGISWQVEHSKNGAACGLRWSIKLAAKSPSVAKLLGAALPTALKSWKMTPLMVASDVVEWGTTTLASRQGLTPDRAKRIGRNAGIMTAAVVGTCVAGPVGATAMVGLHVATSQLADRLVGAVTRLG